MWEIFQYSFMVRAFLGGAIIAVIAPLIGSFLVIRRYSLIADTLSHVALSGVALALLLGTQPLLTTVIVTVLAAILIEKLRVSNNLPGEAVLAMFLPGGLALSLVLLSMSGGVSANLFSYLFGSITTVQSSDLVLMLGLGLITVASVVAWHKKLLYSAFDEESARVSGISVGMINTLLIVLTAITVSLSMRVVGVLLVGALMVVPVLAAMQLAKSFTQTLLSSVVLAQLAVMGGLLVAYFFNLPAGGTIVLLSLTLFGLSTLLKVRL